jgi:D-sedoheptulose 7-phosphate isomerase
MKVKTNLIQQNFLDASDVLAQFISDKKNFSQIEKAGKLLVHCIKKGGKIISCGNGGSMCDAMHFAEELSGRFRENRKALPALSISDPSHLSCVANDYGYDFVFSRYIEAIALTGKNGGKIAPLCDIEIRAPFSHYADRAQEIHIKVIHSLIHYIETNI